MSILDFPAATENLKHRALRADNRRTYPNVYGQNGAFENAATSLASYFLIRF